MASLVRLVINSSGTAADFKSECPLAVGGLDAATNFAAYIDGLAGGNNIGASLAFKVGAVQATATIVSAAGGSAADESMTLCNVTLTAVAADPGENEFIPSATAATQAARIAACINASGDLAGLVTAAVTSGGTVTVTAVVPGVLGNGLQIADVDLANVTVNAFANGADGTAYTLDLD